MSEARHSTLRTLNETFRGYHRYVLMLAVLGMLGAVFEGIGINAIIPLISFLLGGNSLPTDAISRTIAHLFSLVGVPFIFRYLLIFIVILFITRSVILAVFTYIRGFIGARFFASEVSALFRGTMQVQWPFMIRQKAGHVQNAIYWDVKRNMSLLDGIVQFIQSFTGALIYILVALNISRGITLITLLVGLVILLFYRPLISRVRRLGQDTSSAEKSLASHIGEYLQGFKSVKAAGATEGIIKTAQRYLEHLRLSMVRTAFIQGLGGVFIQPLSFLFIIGVFAYSYKSAAFNIASFGATLYLIQKIFVYLDSTQASFTSIAQLIPFAESVSAYKRKIREHGEMESSDGKAFAFRQNIEFRDVSFSYEGGARVLTNISFAIPRGTMVGIVGPSGGGKTSLVDLLLRLFRPSEGQISLDGTSIEQTRMKEWRRHIAYVSQDIFLMNDSVTANIRFFDETVSDEDIRSAAKAAHIYDDIMRLPEGFDTHLGDRGVTLSGGQRQRIALARALARKPDLLVLDEVTSALDSELEQLIQNVIDELRGSITLVVIAHRISTVVSADLMLVLEEGRITDARAPELMLKDPLSYLSRMRNLQGGGA